MNEKYLWELWAKCKHPHPKYGGGDMVWPIEFAELIVRECVKLQYKNVVVGGVSEYNRGRRELAEEILKHFGVEE